MAFATLTDVERFWAKSPGAPLWACLIEMAQYPSFLTEIVLRQTAPPAVRVEIEHRSYAMDAYGDATHVAVHYELPSLEAALGWIHRKYLHTIDDLREEPHPLPADYPHAGLPRHRGETRRQQIAWKRLRDDFRRGRLIDKRLRVVYRFDGF
jgi:hypothetical protein